MKFSIIAARRYSVISAVALGNASVYRANALTAY